MPRSRAILEVYTVFLTFGDILAINQSKLRQLRIMTNNEMELPRYVLYQFPLFGE
jgi:hypothetical protein